MSARRALRQHRVPFLSMAAVAAAVLAGCSGSSAPSGGGSASSGSAASSAASGSGPIVIGASLSLDRRLQRRRPGFKNGYEFWASHVNAHGGLLAARSS